MLHAGIVGLPNAGKSTLFNALTKGRAEAAAHPFTTVDANVGVAAVPDPRLEAIVAALRPERVVPAHVRFVDIAGLIRGAHRGEGLGNRFLGHVREADLVVVVLRAFASGSVPHPDGAVDPRGDLETLLTELALADLETASGAAPKAAKRAAATRADDDRHRAEALARAIEALDRGVPVRGELAPEELAALGDAWLLTAKPFLYVLNVGENEVARAQETMEALRPALPANAPVVAISARLEEEVAALEEEEAEALLAEYGIARRGAAEVAEATRRLLGLITFYSIESSECRAWLVREGTTAKDAAGEIHTDMRTGFVRAEVVPAESLAAAGSLVAARERGDARIEGKEYVVRDGDVLTFRFRS